MQQQQFAALQKDIKEKATQCVKKQFAQTTVLA